MELYVCTVTTAILTHHSGMTAICKRNGKTWLKALLAV
jgi:hypothetical protein